MEGREGVREEREGVREGGSERRREGEEMHFSNLPFFGG